MLTSPDFKELLSILAKHKVRYLVVGGYAVMRYSEPRYTKDLDLWVAIDSDNAQRVFSALKVFGAPLAGMTPDDFTQPQYFYQLGKPPFRLDIMLSIPGVDFEMAWSRREETTVQGVTVAFISKDDLIKSKKASGRPQDLLDVDRLTLHAKPGL